MHAVLILCYLNCLSPIASLVVCAQDVPKVGRVVHAHATSVSEAEVQLDDGSSLPFDYLVLASGSTWDDPVNSGTDPLLTDRKLNQQASCPLYH